MKIFGRKKIKVEDIVHKTGKSNKESIYNRIVLAEEKGQKEELDLEKYKIETSIDKDIEPLFSAFMDYYNKNYKAVDEFYKYFFNHKAQDIINRFENRIFSLEIFDEQKMVGLSILLMRDIDSIEAIKFGMMLSSFYSLENAPGAIKLITDLGTHSEFTRLALKQLKQVRFYEILKDNILRRGNEKVRGIEREIK